MGWQNVAVDTDKIPGRMARVHAIVLWAGIAGDRRQRLPWIGAAGNATQRLGVRK